MIEDGDVDSEESDDGTNGNDGDDGSNYIMVLMRAQVVFIACSMPSSPGEGAEKTKGASYLMKCGPAK